MQVCLHKIGARLLGKLTICIENAGSFGDSGTRIVPILHSDLVTEATHYYVTADMFRNTIKFPNSGLLS